MHSVASRVVCVCVNARVVMIAPPLHMRNRITIANIHACVASRRGGMRMRRNYTYACMVRGVNATKFYLWSNVEKQSIPVLLFLIEQMKNTAVSAKFKDANGGIIHSLK